MKEDDESDNQTVKGSTALKIVAVLILFPLIPAAVAKNFLGAADHLAFLPGVQKGGGVFSGLATLSIIVVGVGIVGWAGITAIGATAGPIIDQPPNSTDGSALTPTSTTSTPSEVPPTETQATSTTSTPSPNDVQRDYQVLRNQYLELYPNPSDPDNDVTPPILGTEIRDDELWVVFDETDVFENGTRMRLKWTTVTNVYAGAVDEHTGHTPVRMRGVGWNNTGPIDTFSVQTYHAQAIMAGNISFETYYWEWFQMVRATTDDERRIAREIAEHPPDDN